MDLQIDLAAYSIRLPDESWNAELEDGILSIYNSYSLQGVIQISSFISKHYVLSIDDELKKERAGGRAFRKIDIAGYQGLYEVKSLLDQNIDQHEWIIGHHYTRLFITAIINSCLSKEEKESAHNLVFSIIKTIVFTK